MSKSLSICLMASLVLFTQALICQPQAMAEASSTVQVDVLYRILPGDVLNISVWGEETMQNKDLRVLPDGTISYPLTGVIEVKGKTIAEVANHIADKLKVLIPEPNVNVMVQAAEGSVAYVIGKVNKSGSVPLYKETTVLQALSMAGSFDRFADTSDIKVIRFHKGQQEIIKFDYDDVAKGKNLVSNILLKPGDTVVVP